MRRAGLCIAGAALLVTLPGAVPVHDLTVSVGGLRSGKGVLQLCLTRDPAFFPDCSKDPARRHLTVMASKPSGIVFTAVPPGLYALSVLHDENANDRLDTFMGIPKEGIGFSRNPRLHFGPPRFNAVEFDAADGANLSAIQMKYFL
ncbi:MAG: DUF2141 domain-containing protein [Alphaproteobacteria bacterium]|nr:DUF2141 domain-containing protein [Alphaproteobacteria bacterium]